jgi:FkbM family methyltransferase
LFDNVNRKDKVILTVSSPARMARSFVEFNQLYVLPTVRHVKGWWSVGFVYYGLSKDSTVTLKDGSKVRFNKSNVTELISKLRHLDLSEETIRRFRIKIKGNRAVLYAGGRKLTVGIESLSSIVGEFLSESHKIMDVKGKDVVDIGAYVGETTIYYATEGKAKNVYAYELFPHISRIAKANVRMSGLSGRVKVFNEGIGGKPGSIMISRSESSFGKLDAKHHKDKIRVRILSLDQIVKMHKINNGALKVDCEGYEYEIFRNASSKAIRSFSIIHIEYHYGYSDLVKRLEKEGFKVKRTNPIMTIKGFSKPMLNGDIIAVRNGRSKEDEETSKQDKG